MNREQSTSISRKDWGGQVNFVRQLPEKGRSGMERPTLPIWLGPPPVQSAPMATPAFFLIRHSPLALPAEVA